MSRDDDRARRRPRSPCALSIAGLDPGGGAGIAADLRAFAAANVFGCAAVALVTVQSTDGVRSVRALPAREVIAQAREVLRAQRVRAVKVGALGSAANVRAVGELLAIHRDLPAVIDTVMLPSRGGARLLAEAGVAAMRGHLLPRSALVTANAPEAQALTRASVTNLKEARRAAVALVALGARAALVKGGHLSGKDATDVLALGPSVDDVLELRAPRLEIGPLHGGGCVLASLIAGRLAAKVDGGRKVDASLLERAVRWAKRVHHEALARAVDVGGEMRVVIPSS